MRRPPALRAVWGKGEAGEEADVTIAALYVEKDGCYFGLPDVDPWPVDRDARLYAGPWPVVAHPPCERWGRYWHGSTRKPHQYKLGDDGGCFEAALNAVRTYGGVLEHPADSHAWECFGLPKPKRGAGWLSCGYQTGFTCYVEQGHYGHFSRKPTRLYVCRVERPELNWTRLPQRLHPTALAKYGYEKARRIGVMAMIGGKRKTEIRNATPIPFRDLLLGMARSAACKACGGSGRVASYEENHVSFHFVGYENCPKCRKQASR
jgi:hypothetical protein